MSEKKPFLELNLSFGKVAFYNLDEIDEWVGKELEFWRWPDNFSQHKMREYQCRVDIVNFIRSPLDRIKAVVNGIRGNQDDNAHDRLVADLRNKINEAYTRPHRPVPPDQSQKGEVDLVV